MPFNVKILSKDQEVHNGEFGEYNVLTLTYDYKGESRILKVFPSTLKTFPNLKEELKKVVVGETVGLDFEKMIKNGKQTQLLSKITIGGAPAKPATAKTNSGSSNWKSDWKPDPGKDAAIQAMNALKVAADTLGKCTTKQLMERAWEVVVEGEILKERMLRGEHKNQPEKRNEASQSHSVDLDDETDVPF